MFSVILVMLVNWFAVLMTRDFLDFEVMHLSSTTNQFPQLENFKLQEELIYRMQQTVESLRVNNSATFTHRYRDQRILQQTVVIVPFSNHPANQNVHNEDIKHFTDKLRYLYLQATIWSIYRTFPRIMVSFENKIQLEAIKALNLPIWKYLDLSNDIKDRHLLPRETLMYTIRKLKLNTTALSPWDEDKAWQDINYIYYSEADQIIHSRHLPNLYYILDRLERRVALVPHRVQVKSMKFAYCQHILIDLIRP